METYDYEGDAPEYPLFIFECDCCCEEQSAQELLDSVTGDEDG